MSPHTARRLAAATVLIAALACSNRKTAIPGKDCLINSDCENPLACTYGKCHEACHEAGDCPGDGVCVYALVATASDDAPISEPAAGTPKVCVQETCAMNSECAEPLVCGRDLRCRQACAANRDCPYDNQLCVVGNDRGQKVCAEAKDIGDTGQLAPPDGGVAPGGGGGGAGGGFAGGGASAGSGGAAGDAVVADREPNDDKATAAPYALGTEVSGTLGAGDAGTDPSDYYELVAPATDPSGGYFQASLTKVGAGAVHAEVYSPADSGRLLLADTASTGQLSSFFWAARPGQHFLVRFVEATVVPTFDYSFKVSYTRIDDPLEPNDDSDTPAPIALGTPITAYFFDGFSSSAVPAADQDWYAVTLAAGTTSVAITSVPHDLRMQFVVYDAASFVQVSATGFVGANSGASLNGSFTADKSGTYLIGIQAFSFLAGSVAGVGTTLPDSFTRPYTLTVTQP
jgi:hypothetical protein